MIDNQSQKIVVVVRSDLDLPVGKWVAQGIHAVLRVHKTVSYDHQGDLPVCIVCSVKSREELISLHQRALQYDLPSAVQFDAGHNHLDSGTPTALCIGPATPALVDQVTRKLRIWKD